MPEALLSIEELVVDYGRIRALKGISLSVGQGELVAVIGSNGAGKTTMMKTISGLLKPTSGRVLFDGKPLSGVPAHRVVKLGVAQVPEGRRVFAQQSVRDNLVLGAFLRLRGGQKREVAEDTERMFSIFPRLRERQDQLAGTLSGGEQQMLAIARALLSRPKLLLLDEPSMGLAPVIIDEVFALIERLKAARDTTLLLVEQLAFRALEVADRAYVIEQGSIKFGRLGQGTARQPVGPAGLPRRRCHALKSASPRSDDFVARFASLLARGLDRGIAPQASKVDPSLTRRGNAPSAFSTSRQLESTLRLAAMAPLRSRDLRPSVVARGLTSAAARWPRRSRPCRGHAS